MSANGATKRDLFRVIRDRDAEILRLKELLRQAEDVKSWLHESVEDAVRRTAKLPAWAVALDYAIEHGTTLGAWAAANKDCPICGAYARRCSMDIGNRTICAITGKPSQ